MRALQTPETVPVVVDFGYYLSVLALTCLLETPFYLMAFGATAAGTFKGWTRRLSAITFANVCTHPLIYFVLPAVVAGLGGRYLQTLSLAEVFAPMVEASLLIVIWKVPRLRAIGFTFTANLFSWWVGIYWV